MNKNQLFCFSFSIILAFSQQVPNPSLIISLFRNGPIEPIASEIDNAWTSPFELMNIGVEQNLLLGNLLAKKYSYLVQDITPQEIYLQASDHHSTQMSLSAQVFGFFQGRAEENIEVPMATSLPPFEDASLLNTISKDLQDKQGLIPNRFQLLKPNEDLPEVTPSNCYAIFQGHQQRYHSEIAAQMMNDFSETIQKLQELGYNITHIRGLAHLGDILESRFLANKPELNGIEYLGSLYNDIVFIHKWWSFYNSVGDETERSLKIFSLYTNLVDWLILKATSDYPLKMALLNGYKSLLFSMLSVYNITNHQCLYENYKSEKAGRPFQYPDCIFPEYGSQLIFEFTRGQSYIKAFYNGKPIKICKDTTGFECHITQFIAEKTERIGLVSTKEDLQRLCTAPTTTSGPEEQAEETFVDINEEEIHDITYISPPQPSSLPLKPEETMNNTKTIEENLDLESEVLIESKSMVLLRSKVVNGLVTTLVVLIVILLYVVYLLLTDTLVLAKNVASVEKKDFRSVIEMSNSELEETNETSVNPDSHC